MDSVPWRKTENERGHQVPMSTADGAPVRIYDAWEQKRKAESDSWDDKAEENLQAWGKFFDTLLKHHSDVTSLVAECGHIGGLEAHKEAYDRGGFYALHVCAALGFVSAMAHLLKNGFDPEMECVSDANIGLWDEVSDVITRGVRPLHFAAKYGQTDAVNMLLDHGVDVNSRATTCQGELEKTVNSIQIAAKEGHMSTAALLLDRGADIACGGCYGRAEVCGGTAFVRLLMARGHPVEASSVSTMLMSVANTSFRFRSKAETVAAVEEVLNLMADLHIKPSKKALSVFLRNGSISRDAMLEIVILLVLYGASVANENGSLLVAAFQGNERLIRLMFMLGWNAGGSMEHLKKKSGRALQDLTSDARVMERLPNLAASSLHRLAQATELLEEATQQVSSLQVWCRWSILAAIQDPRKVSQLPISPTMKSFILLTAERQEVLNRVASEQPRAAS